MTVQEPCDLCLELTRQSVETEFHATYMGDPPGRVLASTTNLRLIADLSPLTEGHALLLPIEHHLNFATVLDRHGEEVAEFLEYVSGVYRSEYGNLTVLEHGSATAMLGSACIHHAHLHLLPIDGSAVDSVMTRDGLIPEDLSRLADLANRAMEDEPYFLRFDESTVRLYGIGTFRASQYLRSVSAEVIGLPAGAYDWSAVVRKQAMRETCRRLSAAFARDGGRE
ncbi:HIT family protein [Blastococcus sp. SYSU DS0539]